MVLCSAVVINTCIGTVTLSSKIVNFSKLTKFLQQRSLRQQCCEVELIEYTITEICKKKCSIESAMHSFFIYKLLYCIS